MKRTLLQRTVVGITLSAVPCLAFARSLKEVKASGELRACFSPLESYIFEAKPEGCGDKTACTFSGVAYEHMQGLAASLKVKLKPVIVKWDEQFFNDKGVTEREAEYTPALLASGKCDVYPSHLTKNAWRLKKLDFVTVYPNRMMVLVRKERKGEFRGSASLGGKSVATVKDTSFHTWLQQANENQYKSNPMQIVFVSNEEMAKVVEDKRADAVVVDSEFAIYVTNKKYRSLTSALTVGESQEIGWAFRKDDKDLREMADTFVKRETADASSGVNAAWNKYFGISLYKFIRQLEAL